MLRTREFDRPIPLPTGCVPGPRRPDPDPGFQPARKTSAGSFSGIGRSPTRGGDDLTVQMNCLPGPFEDAKGCRIHRQLETLLAILDGHPARRAASAIWMLACSSADVPGFDQVAERPASSARLRVSSSA